MNEKMFNYLDKLVKDKILIQEPQKQENVYIYTLASDRNARMFFFDKEEGAFNITYNKGNQYLHYSLNYYGIAPRLAFYLNMPKSLNKFMNKYLGRNLRLLKRSRYFIR